MGLDGVDPAGSDPAGEGVDVLVGDVPGGERGREAGYVDQQPAAGDDPVRADTAAQVQPRPRPGCLAARSRQLAGGLQGPQCVCLGCLQP
ncbi:MAG TPA: hypothetical protein VFJ14_12680 [Nocardioidaceae bacterium]|nr:hypothetical protein [Nocardioidaceae bacterium]